MPKTRHVISDKMSGFRKLIKAIFICDNRHYFSISIGRGQGSVYIVIQWSQLRPCPHCNPGHFSCALRVSCALRNVSANNIALFGG